MSKRNSLPRALFLGLTYAGNHTRFLNLRHDVEHEERIRPEFSSVTGWKEGGLIERMSFLPHGVRGRARGVIEASALARFP